MPLEPGVAELSRPRRAASARAPKPWPTDWSSSRRVGEYGLFMNGVLTNFEVRELVHKRELVQVDDDATSVGQTVLAGILHERRLLLGSRRPRQRQPEHRLHLLGRSVRF